jgi:hypothetical protein
MASARPKVAVATELFDPAMVILLRLVQYRPRPRPTKYSAGRAAHSRMPMPRFINSTDTQKSAAAASDMMPKARPTLTSEVPRNP